MGAALLAAIKAIPGLVEAINRLGDTMLQVQEISIDNKYTELKEEVREITKRIENAKSDDDRRNLARELNTLISK